MHPALHRLLLSAKPSGGRPTDPPGFRPAGGPPPGPGFRGPPGPEAALVGPPPGPGAIMGLPPGAAPYHHAGRTGS